MAVYVISNNGKPLMPTTRCGHVRRLLKNNQAIVKHTLPFTIQLLYDTADIVQPLWLGIDPGRTNIGVSVLKEDATPVFTASVETRNKEIPKLMQTRKQFRIKHRQTTRRKKKQRRALSNGTIKTEQFQKKLPQCDENITLKYINNKEARFCNRKRKEDWLTPTANQLLLTHLNLIKKLQKFLPISDIVLEVNSFWFNELDEVSAQNPLQGYNSRDDKVYQMQEGHCIFCNKKIDHYHHVMPRHNQGSESVINIVGLCEAHHTLVHTDTTWKEKLLAKVQGRNKKFGALSVLNQIIPSLVKQLKEEYGEQLYFTDGYTTSSIRSFYQIDKDHHLDAYCIALSQLNIDRAIKPTKVYMIKQYRRHDRQVIHKENCHRRYYLNDKVVATNRHKAFEQTTISLDEYVAQGGRTDNLAVKPHPPITKRLNRILPGSKWLAERRMRTLRGSQGSYKGNPAYLIFEDNARVLYRKCALTNNNKGLVFIQ